MDPLAPLIKAFHAEGRPRVWSLVITIFGDAVQHRGGRIATLRLQHLLERVEIEAGALRTALSRLTNDGWVLRDREGRNSFYRLSANGQAEIAKATPHIYAPPTRDKINEWVMASGLTEPQSGIPIAAQLWLIPAHLAPDLADHICLTGKLTSFPENAAKNVLSKAHKDAIAKLQADIAAIDGEVLGPLDAMAARMLLIHRWRRIVLRFPDIPPELFPADATVQNPRELIAKAYHSLAQRSEVWLHSPAESIRPMPSSTADFTNRFLK